MGWLPVSGPLTTSARGGSLALCRQEPSGSTLINRAQSPLRLEVLRKAESAAKRAFRESELTSRQKRFIGACRNNSKAASPSSRKNILGIFPAKSKRSNLAFATGRKIKAFVPHGIRAGAKTRDDHFHHIGFPIARC